MSHFKSIEVSDPQFESNNLRFITVKTPNLKGRGDICVYVPQGIRADDVLPIVILLHGAHGSAWNWTHSAGVHLKLDELIKAGELPPMILAMPSDGMWGDGSAYLQHSDFNFENWIVNDVPNAVIETIKGAKKTSPLFIAGLSMGGFGALRIGAKHGNKFKAISAHSAITSLAQIKFFAEEPLKNYCQNDIIDEDVMATFKHYRKTLPPVRFDCGTTDLLIKYNRELHNKLKQENIAHIYEEHDGGHEWSYWAAHVVNTLKFFASHLYIASNISLS
jgi:putative tributyrin esterase